jgi:glycogen debranching enzyme
MSDIIEVKGQYYIRANASIADAETRVLKHGETFAIFDRHGDVRPLGFENQGVFHEGTRFISRWKLKLSGTSPLLLSSNVREDNDFLVVDLTNPVLQGDEEAVPHGTIHLVRTIFLWEGTYFEKIEISSFASTSVRLHLELEFESDFADLFELRGTTRVKRGSMLPSEVKPEGVVLSYQGLDAIVRQTRIEFNPQAEQLHSHRALFAIELQPQEKKRIEARAACVIGDKPESPENLQRAFDKAHSAYETYHTDRTEIESTNPQFNDWIRQSRADLHLLLTHTPEGPYPFAGIPWFSCIFGRDGIITALETLWVYPEISRAVLAYLASKQATKVNPEKDAEPGKILHEERKGEMADLSEVPFGSYYGSIDSTPLWIILAGHYLERTGDTDFIKALWPHVDRALEWMDKFGDCDGDGFVEYKQRSTGGLINQGWKDSEDSVFHADGRFPPTPIALCEVQAYVYEARLRAAQIAEALGEHARAGQLKQQATTFKERFHKAFWCEEIGTYALALDGEKKQCRVRSSNAGHCLFTGLATEESAIRTKDLLFTPDSFSGWGIRTVPKTEARYNPMSYHNGSIWPHDNALIASGLARYGFKTEARRILSALFDASQSMDLNRLPELYCGFERRRGEGPTLYPVACNPQAWASAAMFLALQAALGLRIEAATGKVYFDTPSLPATVQHLEIANLKVGSGSVDVSLVRHEEDVAVNVRRRSRGVEIIVSH